MTRKDTQIIAAETRTAWQAYEDIARMLENAGVTVDCVLGLEAAIRYNKADLWKRSHDEWTNAYDNSMETLGLNAIAASHIAEIMEEHDPYGYNTESPWDVLCMKAKDLNDEEHETLAKAIVQSGTLKSGDVLYCDGKPTNWVYVDVSTYWEDQLVDFDALVPHSAGVCFFAHKKNSVQTEQAKLVLEIKPSTWTHDDDDTLIELIDDDTYDRQELSFIIRTHFKRTDDDYDVNAIEKEVTYYDDPTGRLVWMPGYWDEDNRATDKLYDTIARHWNGSPWPIGIKVYDNRTGAAPVTYNPATKANADAIKETLKNDGYEYVDALQDWDPLGEPGTLKTFEVWVRPSNDYVLRSLIETAIEPFHGLSEDICKAFGFRSVGEAMGYDPDKSMDW